MKLIFHSWLPQNLIANLSAIPGHYYLKFLPFFPFQFSLAIPIFLSLTEFTAKYYFSFLFLNQ
jgi:hypothetical protein